MQRFEKTPRPTAVVVWSSAAKRRWVRCAARRIQASEPTLTAFNLATKRRAECATSQPVLMFCISQRDLTAAGGAAAVYEYAPTDWCAPSALLLVSRSEPAPADCGLATERRADRASGAKQLHYRAVSLSN